jgi:hypothetical protein
MYVQHLFHLPHSCLLPTLSAANSTYGLLPAYLLLDIAVAKTLTSHFFLSPAVLNCRFPFSSSTTALHRFLFHLSPPPSLSTLSHLPLCPLFCSALLKAVITKVDRPPPPLLIFCHRYCCTGASALGNPNDYH